MPAQVFLVRDCSEQENRTNLRNLAITEAVQGDENPPNQIVNLPEARNRAGDHIAFGVS